MTESLEALSVHLGFRQMVQSYCPRHMVAKLLRAARGEFIIYHKISSVVPFGNLVDPAVDIERIKDIMAHDVRGSGIGYYMGRSMRVSS